MSKLLIDSPQTAGETPKEAQLVEEVGQIAEQRAATRMNRRRMLAGLGLAAGAAER